MHKIFINEGEPADAANIALGTEGEGSVLCGGCCHRGRSDRGEVQARGQGGTGVVCINQKSGREDRSAPGREERRAAHP